MDRRNSLRRNVIKIVEGDTSVKLCSICNIIIRINGEGNMNNVEKHLNSEIHHDNLQNQPPKDTVSKKIRDVAGASSQVIFEIFEANKNKKRLYCITCHSCVQATVAHVKDHIGTKKHRNGKNAIDLYLTDKSNIFARVNGKENHLHCKMCDCEFFVSIVSNIKNHENLLAHIGISKENADPFFHFQSDENDPFKSQRAKYTHRAHIKINKSHPELQIKFIDGQIKLYCTFCKTIQNDLPTEVVKNHIKGPRHLENVPNEDGITQKEFVYDLCKTFASSKYSSLNFDSSKSSNLSINV